MARTSGSRNAAAEERKAWGSSAGTLARAGRAATAATAASSAATAVRHASSRSASAASPPAGSGYRISPTCRGAPASAPLLARPRLHFFPLR